MIDGLKQRDSFNEVNMNDSKNIVEHIIAMNDTVKDVFLILFNADLMRSICVIECNPSLS